jgi:N-sulfoglucosamine sulfohydrolase
MKRSFSHFQLISTLLFLLILTSQPLLSQGGMELPNILWITSEDNSPMLGCYGDDLATSPNLDQLAREGFMYTRAYANCPVCAPARNTIITGVYAASNGNEQMRSTYKKSDKILTYAELLREAGYYCTNNVKTDYNTPDIDPSAIWDESSNTAHYKNRPEGKPFFAIFNLTESHESSIFHKNPFTGNEIPVNVAPPKHNPARVVIPPYHPDIPEMRHDWALYYDKIEIMDGRVGELLRELDRLGEADNTIVFYYGDHGGVLARSKRYVYETGTRVPFIIRIPEKFKDLYPAGGPGSPVDRLVSFVDLAPTLLSIVGAEIPGYMQGDAFLGEKTTAPPEYVHMTRGRMDERIDMSRAVRNKEYRYIRNYMPFRIPLQHLAFLFTASSAQAWEDMFKAGKTNALQSVPFQPTPVEELYDTENDPWEVRNLAADPAYAEVLQRMRAENRRWMAEIRDVGLVPETEYPNLAGSGSMYDYMHSGDCPLEELLAAAESATMPGEGEISAYMNNLQSKHPAIRYWGATGLLIHLNESTMAIPSLQKASRDESSSVATLAAEALFWLGQKDLAVQTYIRILSDPSYQMMDRNFALNSVDAIHLTDQALTDAVKQLYEDLKDKVSGFARFNAFDFLMAENLLKQWGEL